ncbi:hypothetical protein F4801DRAFT_482329 [Xylaria longipes]|nr:hypothetical protein F4801DRAFT_482329 [Xylaria longipes]
MIPTNGTFCSVKDLRDGETIVTSFQPGNNISARRWDPQEIYILQATSKIETYESIHYADRRGEIVIAARNKSVEMVAQLSRSISSHSQATWVVISDAYAITRYPETRHVISTIAHFFYLNSMIVIINSGSLYIRTNRLMVFFSGLRAWSHVSTVEGPEACWSAIAVLLATLEHIVSRLLGFRESRATYSEDATNAVPTAWNGEPLLGSLKSSQCRIRGLHLGPIP